MIVRYWQLTRLGLALSWGILFVSSPFLDQRCFELRKDQASSATFANGSLTFCHSGFCHVLIGLQTRYSVNIPMAGKIDLQRGGVVTSFALCLGHGASFEPARPFPGRG